MDIFEWLQNWYSSHCDGNWEHENQIKIETLDNPGWNIEIDIKETNLSFVEDIPWELFEKAENDWYGKAVKNGKYIASGDSNKLIFLLEEFRKFTNDVGRNL